MTSCHICAVMSNCGSLPVPAQARFRTSSTWCKRTGASTTSSWDIPARRPVSSGTVSNGDTVALKPVSLKTPYWLNHGASDMFAACHGTGKLPGTDCRMDAFDKEGSSGGPRGVKYPEYVYVPHEESKPYWAWPNEWVLADHMFQSQLDESFVAHQYVIAAQADSSVNVPLRPVGMRGRQRRPRAQRTEGNVSTAATRRRASTTRPSATSSTSAEAALALLHQQLQRAVQRLLVGLSGREPHLQRARLEERRHHAAETLPARRRTWRAAAFTWITPTCPGLRSHRVRRGVRSVVGGLGRQRRGARASSGIRPRSSCSGTIGAVSTIRWRHRSKITTVFGFRVPLIVISAVRQAKLRFARAVRNCERAPLCRGSLRASATRGRG